MDVQIACPCPPKDGEPRHATDSVTLRETLDFRAATTIRNSIAFAKAEDPDLSSAEMLAILTEGYLLHGIEAWTLVDLDDKKHVFAVPVSKPEIRSRLLADPLMAEPIGEAADVLYQPIILGPLVQRALTSLPPSSTDESTSPKKVGAPRSPTRSKRSSTSTTPTDGIVTTTDWHGGVSKSSPNTATAI